MEFMEARILAARIFKALDDKEEYLMPHYGDDTDPFTEEVLVIITNVLMQEV